MPKRKKFDKITQVKGMKIHYNGDSPSGKATDSDSVIRVFESLIPSQAKHHPIEGWCFVCVVVKSEKARINGCSRDEQETIGKKKQ